MLRVFRVIVIGMSLAAVGGCVAAVPYHVESEYGVDDPRFIQTMSNLFGPSMIRGNRVTTLINGDEIFPAMLGAIRSAETSVTFETYMFWDGKVSEAFVAALIDRAKAGVKVHMIIDSIGSVLADRDDLRALREAGVELNEYHKLHWWQWWTAAKLNYRTHRKLLVVDGKVGFIGGVGIADNWAGDARNTDEWRDNHYRVEGPIVGQIQAAFMDNWVQLTGRVLHGDDYFPPVESVGDTVAQVLKSSTGDSDESVHLMFLMSLAAARERVCISTPYFVPDVQTTHDLIETARRGVKVRVIVPGRHIDSKITRQASRADWGPLLEAGVEIYEYQPTMIHVKLMVVDDLWVSIGSANFDNRSFRLNDEANMNVLDPAFAAQQTRLFEDDLANSKRVTHEQWRKRSPLKKLLDGTSTLLSPQL